MSEHFIDLDEVDFADEMIRQIEKNYGRSIARIAKFFRTDEPNIFDITFVFTDFKILEATISVIPSYFDMPSIHVEGIYY